MASRGGDPAGRQGQMGSGFAGRPRQKIAAADIGQKADAGFRHGDGGGFGHDAVGGVRRNADAAAHDDPVHHRDNRLLVIGDLKIERIFLAPIVYGPRIGGQKRIVDMTNVAAGAKGALARAAQQHEIDAVVVAPPGQRFGDLARHMTRQRIEAVGAIEGDPADPAAEVDEHIGV